jgi:hypothetical protein
MLPWHSTELMPTSGTIIKLDGSADTSLSNLRVIRLGDLFDTSVATGGADVLWAGFFSAGSGEHALSRARHTSIISKKCTVMFILLTV